MRQLVRNGPTKYPGANFIRPSENSPQQFVKNLAYANREQIAQNLQIGEVVERHMLDEDPVLFNRQPSLHKLSIMCHRAKVNIYAITESNILCLRIV